MTARNCTSCGRDMRPEEVRTRTDKRCHRPVELGDCHACHLAYKQEQRRRKAEASGRAFVTWEEARRKAQERTQGRLDGWREQQEQWAQRRQALRQAPNLTCTICNVEQPRGRFHESMLKKVMVHCKACVKARDEARFKALKANKQAYQKRLQSPLRRIRNRVGSSMRAALIRKTGSKEPGVFRHLGYTLDDLRTHLERTFAKGMRWDNMRRWHIDHIVPVSAFSFTSVDAPGFRACYALTNLRALWKKKNLSKGAKRTHLL